MWLSSPRHQGWKERRDGKESISQHPHLKPSLDTFQLCGNSQQVTNISEQLQPAQPPRAQTRLNTQMLCLEIPHVLFECDSANTRGQRMQLISRGRVQPQVAPRGPVSPGHRMPPPGPSWDRYKAHRGGPDTPGTVMSPLKAHGGKGVILDTREVQNSFLTSAKDLPWFPPSQSPHRVCAYQKEAKNLTTASVHCSQQAATRDPVPQFRPLNMGLLQQHGTTELKASHRADHSLPTLTQTGEIGEYRG